MNRSYLIQAFDEIKPYMRFSRDDAHRLQRGLELALRGEERPYITTHLDCTCPDHQFTGFVCKHMRQAQLERRAAELEYQARQTQAHASEILEALREVTRYFAVSCALAGTADRHPALLKAREVLNKLQLPEDCWF